MVRNEDFATDVRLIRSSKFWVVSYVDFLVINPSLIPNLPN